MKAHFFRLLWPPAVLLLFSGITGFLLNASDPWKIRAEKIVSEIPPEALSFEGELFEVFRGDIAETISKETVIPKDTFQIETAAVPAGKSPEAGDLTEIGTQKARILSVRKSEDPASGLLIQNLPAQELSLTFPVESVFCSKLSGRLPVTVSADSFLLTGHITGIGALVEQETVPVTVTVCDDMVLTRPGMKVTVTIVTEEKKDVLLIPAECIFFDRHRYASAMLHTENGIEEVAVETGIADDTFIEICSGLKEGDLVCRAGT